jgi:DNA repair protein RecN (Recombination protein N)
VGRTVQELRRIDSSAEEIVTLQEQAVAALQILQAEISKYEGKVEVDPERLQQLEERLSLIQSLKRKYGKTVAEVIAFGDAAAEKLKKMEGREAELERVNKDIAKLNAEIERTAKILSDKRRKISPQLSEAICKELADLGFKQSRFDVELSVQDAVEFQFSPNPGEPLHPLRAIASSGELARVMLAIKTVLAAEDQVPVLVFDEVDANVGGETANAVGEKMLQIAKSRQVICITHLPQVAAPAHTHFVASKEVRNGRTISDIKPLQKKDRITELARMLGGQTEAARRHAQELLTARS